MHKSINANAKTYLLSEMLKKSKLVTVANTDFGSLVLLVEITNN